MLEVQSVGLEEISVHHELVHDLELKNCYMISLTVKAGV
jgi:hypothetical protein